MVTLFTIKETVEGGGGSENLIYMKSDNKHEDILRPLLIMMRTANNDSKMKPFKSVSVPGKQVLITVRT